MSLANFFSAPMDTEQRPHSPKRANGNQNQAESTTKRRRHPQGRGGEPSGDMMQLLATITLRHEDSINAIVSDLSYQIFMTTEAPSILQSLHAVSAGWNAWAQDKKAEQPLRNKMTSFIFDTLLERVKQLQTEEGAKVAVSEGVAFYKGDSIHMPYLKYNQKTKKNEVDDGKEAVPLQDILDRISAVKEVTSQRDTITRFIPSRRLAAEMKGGPVRFLIQLPAGGAGKIDALHNHLRQLTGHSAFVLIGATMSPGNQQRSPLAKQLEKVLRP